MALLQSAGFSPLPDAEPAALSPSNHPAPSPKPSFSHQDLRLMQRVLGLEEQENGAASYGPAPSSGSALATTSHMGYNGDATNIKPYSKGRPSYAKGQIEQVWENAKDPVTGKVYDPTGAELSWDRSKLRRGQWDMGHIPGHRYADMRKRYLQEEISKQEFLDWYHNPLYYRPELPHTNRSHKFE